MKAILNFDLYPLGCKGDKFELTKENKELVKTTAKHRGIEGEPYTEIKEKKAKKAKAEEAEVVEEAPVEEAEEAPVEEAEAVEE